MREGLRVRESANDEGNRLLRIVRRCSGSGGDPLGSSPRKIEGLVPS